MERTQFEKFMESSFKSASLDLPVATRWKRDVKSDQSATAILTTW